MPKPIIIGITGGMGGGKSTFSAYLRDRGQLVFDTDVVAKKMQDEDKHVIKELKQLFGDDIYRDNGFDRKRVAGMVFGNKELLFKLNAIIHPRVKEKFQSWVKANSDSRFLFMECAILFEGKFDAYVDKILVVTAPENVRIERVMKRDNQSEEQVRARLRNQMSEDEKRRRADWIIETEGVKNTEEKVDTFLKMLMV